MAKLTFPVQPGGLLCDVVLGLNGPTTAALVVAGQAVSSPVRCRGLLDTGTDITCVASTVLQQLGLNSPIVQTTTQTATGIATVDLFEASVSVLDLGNPSGSKLVIPDLLVMALPVVLPGLDVLIGLDVLLTARLLLDGPGLEFTLEF